MQTFEKSSLIVCDLEALFAFHLDLKNLQAITPKDTQVKLLDPLFTPKEGDILRIQSTKYGIATTWEVRIQTLQKPHLLVDVALKSPFALWEHSHIFTQKGAGICELKDRVRYKLPFGWFGTLFNGFIQKQLAAMFQFRHQVTKERLEAR